MLYDVIITKAFESDMDSALEYISDKLYNSSAAARLLDKVTDTISLFEENPFIFPIYHDSEIAKFGYRFAVAGKFLIFYRIDESKK